MRVFWVLLAVAGCVRSASVECGDRICPAGTQCENNFCVTPEQITACAGLTDGAACNPGTNEIAFCHGGLCIPASCGNGLVEGSEQCDSDVLPETDCRAIGYYEPGALTCANDCTYDVTECGGVCGDGVRDMEHEACDRTDISVTDCTQIGYYFSGPVSCNQVCQYDASQCTGFCGDKVVNDTSEFCDGSPPAVASCTTYGFDAGAIGCSQFCTPGLSSCAHFGFEQVASSGTINLVSLYMASDTKAFALDQDFKLQIWNAGTWAPPVELLADGGGVGLYQAIHGSSATNVIAVGWSGAITRFDGTSWTAAPDLVDTDLQAVFVTNANDAWAVGEAGTVLHWNGASWSIVTIPNVTDDLYDVWAAAPDDVFILSNSGVHHLKGTTWTTSSLPSMNRIFGFSPTSVFAVGPSSQSARFDGSTWQPLTGLGASQYADVWGTSPTNVFAVGFNGQVSHFDGRGWGLIPTQTTRGLLSIHGTDSGNILAVGQEGLTMLYRGVHWRTNPGTSQSSSLTSIWGSSSGDIYLGRPNGLLHFDGKTWAPIDLTGATTVYDVWGLAPDMVWATDYSGKVFRWNGTQWALMTTLAGGATGVWGSADNDLYVLTGELWHYDGNNWTKESPPSVWSLWALWGNGPNDVFVTTQSGEILHKGPGGWSLQWAATGNQLSGLWGSGPNDVFAVGRGGQILHYDGTTWIKQDSKTTTELRGVWGTAPDDVFVTGADGLVLHYDGAVWSPVRQPTVNNLATTWTTPRTTILAGALGGDLYRFDRTTPWACGTTEAACGDSVDNDCDRLIDAKDPDCTSNLRLSEIHGGVGAYVEVINRSARTANLDGVTLTMRGSCNTAPVTYTFMPDSIVQPGGVYRAIAQTSSLVAHERPFMPFCDAVSGGGWYALCAGPCDLTSCSNVLDYVEVTGSTTPVSPPDCTAVSVSVTGATATQSAVRIGFAGMSADWTIGTATRD